MRRNSSYACHTPGQVPACMQRVCTYGHRCCNSMNRDDRVRRLATLRKRKQSFNFGRRRVSVNLLATAFTIDFHMPLSHSLFTLSIDTTCIVEYTVYQFNMYFVYYNVMTCTNISYSNMRMREALSAFHPTLSFHKI